jgi:hypothetical protein
MFEECQYQMIVLNVATLWSCINYLCVTFLIFMSVYMIYKSNELNTCEMCLYS